MMAQEAAILIQFCLIASEIYADFMQSPLAKKPSTNSKTSQRVQLNEWTTNTSQWETSSSTINQNLETFLPLKSH